MKLLIGLAILGLAGCVSEQSQPERQWGVKVSKQSEPKIWIFKYDGSKQCGQAPASVTPETAARELKEAGIMVFEAKNGNDGMMHPTVCGANTGNTVEVEIFATDLGKAQSRGYKAMKRQN